MTLYGYAKPKYGRFLHAVNRIEHSDSLTECMGGTAKTDESGRFVLLHRWASGICASSGFQDRNYGCVPNHQAKSSSRLEDEMIQLILHLVGDYVTQSDWMAQNKTKAHWPAFCHALIYSLPFLTIGSLSAVLVIFTTHFAIDRWRLARFVVYAKNFLAPKWISEARPECSCRPVCGNPSHGVVLSHRRNHQWADCVGTGYHKEAPAWLAVWLLIAADNTMHLAINWAALRWL